jgi:hypothetical protein
MLHLYIDANAYLTFFHLTSDDLEELKKLQILIAKTQEVQLHLPEQTRDEFERNREVKIADALKRFREEKLNNQFPQMSKEYPEYNKMREAIKNFDHHKSKLLEKLHTDIFTNKLAADKIINELFSKAKFYQSSNALIEAAKTRYDLGKPPGKNKSYGDALNWETLLYHIPISEDLYFVSDDKDYFSEINQAYFNNYLVTEWYNKKESKIYYYRRISEFFKAKFPDIKIASEYEKELLIKELASRGTFAGARSTLVKLSQFEDFSSQQLNDFVQACNNNNQVFWIKDDEDIEEMISKIVMPNRDKVEPTILAEFDALFGYEIEPTSF